MTVMSRGRNSLEPCWTRSVKLALWDCCDQPPQWGHRRGLQIRRATLLLESYRPVTEAIRKSPGERKLVLPLDTRFSMRATTMSVGIRTVSPLFHTAQERKHPNASGLHPPDPSADAAHSNHDPRREFRPTTTSNTSGEP